MENLVINPLRYWLLNVLFALVLLIYVVETISTENIIMGMSCYVTSVTTFFVVFSPSKSDPLEAIKFVSCLYGLSFGLAPLILFSDGIYNFRYLGGNWSDLLDEGALLAMLGFFSLMAGHSIGGLFFSRRFKNWQREVSEVGESKLIIAGLILLAMGSFSYIGLVISSGGIQHFINYSSGRAEIFQGTFGGFYWGSFFLISGLCAVGTGIVKRHPYMVILLSLIVGLAFFLFQGRGQIIGPIFCGVVIFHYGYRKIRMKTFAISAVLMIVLASIFGVYRGIEKTRIYKNPYQFIASYFEHSEEFIKHTIAGNIEQLDVLLISIRYIDLSKNSLDGSTLLNWLGPLNRFFFNNSLEFVHAGKFMDVLINPEHKYSHTALSPSLPGELYINFEVPGVLIGLFLYGLILRNLYRTFEFSKKPGAFLMIYPYAVWNIGKMVVDGVGLFFKLAVVITPLIVIYFIAVLDRRVAKN